ncbi:MAG: sensor histidine kinase [Miltoncostaeaceae bacterium]
MTEQSATRGARIGGRWAVSARGTLILAAVTLLASLGRSLQFKTWSVGVIVGWLAGMLGVVVVAVLVDRTAFRNRGAVPVPTWWVIAYGAVSGAVWALIAVPIIRAFSTDSVPSLWTTFGQSIVLTVLVLTGCAAVSSEIEISRIRRAAMMRQLLEIRSQDVSRAVLGEAMRVAIEAEITSATAEIREQLELAGAGTDGRTHADFARGLTNAVDRDLRPLSARLAGAATDPIPAPGVARSLGSLVAALTVIPGWTAVLIAVTGVSVITSSTGIPAALVRASVAGVLVWCALALTRRVVARRPHLAHMELPIGAAAATCLMVINFAIGRVLFDAAYPWTILGAIIAWVPMMTLLTAVAARTIAEGTPRMRAMEFAVDERQITSLAANREFVRVSRELAQYVHGTLQSHLLATAFAIDEASRTGDPRALDTAIAKAQLAFDSPQRQAIPDHSLTEALLAQSALWEGFVAVTIDIDVDVRDMGPADVPRVTRVVEEAISNARKHGQALAVAVTVDPAPGDSVRITVRDDGIGPTGGAPGLGSSLLDEAAGTEWQLRSAPEGGAVLSVTMPLGSAPARV